MNNQNTCRHEDIHRVCDDCGTVLDNQVHDKSRVVNQFVKFAKERCHTLGEQHRLQEAADAFLSPPKKGLSYYLKKAFPGQVHEVMK